MYKTKISGFVEDKHTRITVSIEQVIPNQTVEDSDSGVEDMVRDDFERFMDMAVNFYCSAFGNNEIRHTDLEKVETL